MHFSFSSFESFQYWIAASSAGAFSLPFSFFAVLHYACLKHIPSYTYLSHSSLQRESQVYNSTRKLFIPKWKSFGVLAAAGLQAGTNWSITCGRVKHSLILLQHYYTLIWRLSFTIFPTRSFGCFCPKEKTGGKNVWLVLNRVAFSRFGLVAHGVAAVIEMESRNGIRMEGARANWIEMNWIDWNARDWNGIDEKKRIETSVMNKFMYINVWFSFFFFLLSSSVWMARCGRIQSRLLLNSRLV